MVEQRTPDLFAARLLDSLLDMPGEGLPRDVCVVSAPVMNAASGMTLTLPVRTEQDAFALLEAWYGSADTANQYAQSTLNMATGLSDTLLANIRDADERLADAVKRLPKGKLGTKDIESLSAAIEDAKKALSRSKGLRVPGYTLQLHEGREAAAAALKKAEGNLAAFERFPNEKLRKAARSSRNQISLPAGQYIRTSEKAAVLLRNASTVMNFSGRVMAALPISAATFDLLTAKSDADKEKAARRLVKPVAELVMGEIVTMVAPRAAMFILTPFAPGVLTVVAVSIGITALGVYGAMHASDLIRGQIEIAP